jgi:chromosome segregation ATPase
MRHETVTYDLVCQAIDDLAKAGEKITIVNVLRKSGGAAGKIAEFLKRWKNERRLVSAYSISDQLLVAVMAENKLAVDKAIASKDKELSELQGLMTELQEINVQNCKENQDLQAELAMKSEECSILEQELNKAKDTIKNVESQLLLCNEKITVTNELLAAALENEKKAQLEAVASAAKAEQMEKHLNDLYTKFKII